jgi:hypothetical protein
VTAQAVLLRAKFCSVNQDGNTVSRRYFRSSIVRALVATMAVLVFTGPVILFGVYVAYSDDATSPEMQAVPTPPDWGKRRYDTGFCSGSGGVYCNLAVLSPIPETSRTQAEAEYRLYLQDHGWRRVEDDFGTHFQRGTRGEETVLDVPPYYDYVNPAWSSSEPPRGTDILVVARFADQGAATTRAFGLKIVLLGVGLTLLPSAIVASRAHSRRRSKGL